MKRMIERLISTLGGRFSRELGINLSKGKSQEIFKWFLASKLFGARIGTNIAIKTYKEFESCGVLSPDGIIKSGWDGLVRILDDGGYVRYDFSTATKLLGIMNDLKERYNGNLNRLHQKARDERELEGLLKGLGKGIGDVTVNIFLRELRSIWEKARPELSPLARLAARNLGLIRPGEEPLKALEEVWSLNKIQGKEFSDLEAGLVRLGKDYCKRLRCDTCPMRDECKLARTGVL